MSKKNAEEVLPRGLNLVKNALDEAFRRVGPKLLQQLVDEFRAFAQSNHRAYLRLLAENEKEPARSWNRKEYRRRQIMMHSVSLKPLREFLKIAWEPTWNDQRAHPDKVSVDYTEADRQAKFSYDQAKSSFITKNLLKVTEVLGERTAATRDDVTAVKVSFARRGGVFEGQVRVELREGDFFEGELSLKYVIRTNPQYTPYYQYPLNWTGAKVRGNFHKRPSEAELKSLLLSCHALSDPGTPTAAPESHPGVA